jgi:exonuclease SbcC
VKLYSLTLNAIGPFAGEYSVDFAALGQSGLFLLEGPTGAGKSTIIDAIVFALYGGLAGESASKQRLMSHHAPAGARPFVDLTFEVESGIYRVVRTPAYQRPKKRGEGTTQQNETVKLTQLTDLDHLDAGQVVATTTQEVGHEIAGLIGLRKDQFLQTVVLPQGEFAKFLRSDGEQRKQLLESIFRTELYEQITGALGHMRREVKDVVASAQAAVRDAANILASAADVAPDHVLADDEVNQRLVDDLLEQTARQAADAAEIAEQARQAREQAHAQAEHARRAVQVAKRYVELLAERDRLVPQLHDIDLLRGHIELARKAAAVTGAQQAVQRSHEDRQACEAELAAAQLQ